jgi:hypothetical protein
MAAVLIAALFFVSYTVMEGHAVRIQSLNQVKTDASFSEVESILGPASQKFVSPYETQWHYESWTWCSVTISFDENGRVVEIVHDH